MTRIAPGRRFYHGDKRVNFGGGTIGDSAQGTAIAAREGYDWIDCNGHAMHRTVLGKLRGAKDTDIVPVNSHGAPFNLLWQRGKKLETMVWQVQRKRHHDLRSAMTTFRQNGAAGLSTEWEVKDLHPLVSEAALHTYFIRLANAAKTAYGADWQKRVEVKVLSDLGGGLPYAKKVLRIAHLYGFTTIILPRGPHARIVINEPYIDFNRGGRVR